MAFCQALQGCKRRRNDEEVGPLPPPPIGGGFDTLTPLSNGRGVGGEAYYFVEKLYPFPEVFLVEVFEAFEAFFVLLVVVGVVVVPPLAC